MSEKAEKKPSEITVIQAIETSRNKLLEALPKHINVDRFIRTVVTEVSRNPALLKADRITVLSSVMQAAELGLDLSKSLGHASLVVYGDKCQLQIEFKGKISLILRSKEVTAVWACDVNEGDMFDVIMGSEPKIVHVPKFLKKELTHVYACAKLPDGTVKFEVMDRNEVEYIRRTYSKRPNGDAWQKSFGEMAKKTVIHRLAKTLNLSPEVAEAFNADLDVAETITIEPDERQERLKKWEDTQEAEKVPTEAEGDIAKKTFLERAALAKEYKVETVDLYTSTELALKTFDTPRIAAISQVLKTRLEDHA